MTDALLNADDDGRWHLSGTLDYATVPNIWPKVDRLLTAQGDVQISLAGVDRTNSAAMVMLVEARALANKRGCRLQFHDVPADLLELARMSGCDGLILQQAA